MSGANNGDLRGRGAKCFWVFHCGLIEFNLGGTCSMSYIYSEYEDPEKNNLSWDLKKLIVTEVCLQGK